MRKLIAGALAACLIFVPASAFADAAGSAKGVTPLADAALEGATRTLVVGSDIFIGDQVTTGPKGQVQILFADNTKLVVGPHSSLRIDDYLLRNDGNAGKFVVDMLSGSFRFATGNGPKNRYEINTPTGTIGVRGTRFDVFVGPDFTYILHYLGVVLFRARGETQWEELHDLCTLGQITTESSIVGDTRTTTGDFRNQLKAEFIYANNQSPLLRQFWFARAYECLHNAPNVTTVRGTDLNGGGTGLPVTPPTPVEEDDGNSTGGFNFSSGR